MRSSIYVANWSRIAKRLCKSSHERDCQLAETCNLQCTLEQWTKIKKSVTRCNLFSGVCWKTGRLGWPCPSEDAHVSLPCTFCRFLKYFVLKPSLWLKVVNGKRREVLVSALMATFALQKQKRPATAHAWNEDDQVLEALKMTEKIATQLEWIFEMLTGVESTLQNLEGVFESFSALWAGF